MLRLLKLDQYSLILNTAAFATLMNKIVCLLYIYLNHWLQKCNPGHTKHLFITEIKKCQKNMFLMHR